VPGQFQILYLFMTFIQVSPELSDNSSSQIFPDVSSSLQRTLTILALRFVPDVYLVDIWVPSQPNF
jgi:hypothetical protein